jgi:hypothetical protein
MVLVLMSTKIYSQKSTVAEITRQVSRQEAEAHLTFLAADEMRGRDTGSPELKIAGNYIATYFQQKGLKPVPGLNTYFQPVELQKVNPPMAGSATINGQEFTLNENLLVLDGEAKSWVGEFIYVGYGSAEELTQADIRGKMVLALAGSKEADTFAKVYSASLAKRAEVNRLGGEGLVEIMAFAQVPFPALVNFFSRQPRWDLRKQEDKSLTHIWVKPAAMESTNFQVGKSIAGLFTVAEARREIIPGRNVAAFVEGTDAKLKNEVIIITAHYDHIGVGTPSNSGDSIFNGARDNAVGTVALLHTANYLSKFPPKRSVILMALTSEEKGLLGSKWYTEHPVLPLNTHVLNINCDGVGYNDTSIITSISLGKTTTDPLIKKAAKAFGLGVGGDPDPKEGFFERSDQVSFAAKGIPAIKLQPGLARMDDEIRKYYHRQADEVATLDLEYLTKFYRTFVYTVALLADDPNVPFWVKGDKYEEAGKKLYEIN